MFFENPKRDGELVGHRSAAGRPVHVDVPSSVSYTGQMTPLKCHLTSGSLELVPIRSPVMQLETETQKPKRPQVFWVQ